MFFRETDLVVLVSLNVGLDDPAAAADVCAPLVAELGATALRWERADPDGRWRGINVTMYCVSPPMPGESDERGLRRVVAPVLGLFGLPVWDFEVVRSTGFYDGDDAEQPGFTVHSIQAATGLALGTEYGDSGMGSDPLRPLVSASLAETDAELWLHGQVRATSLATAVRVAQTWPAAAGVWATEVTPAGVGRYRVAVVLVVPLPDGDLRRAADPFLGRFGLDPGEFAVEETDGGPVGLATAADRSLYVRAAAHDTEYGEPALAMTDDEAAELVAELRDMFGVRIVLIADLVGDDAPLADIIGRVRREHCVDDVDVEYTASEPLVGGARRMGAIVGGTDLSAREAVEAVIACAGGSGWSAVAEGSQFSSATWTPADAPPTGIRRLEVHAGVRLTVRVTGD